MLWRCQLEMLSAELTAVDDAGRARQNVDGTLRRKRVFFEPFVEEEAFKAKSNSNVLEQLAPDDGHILVLFVQSVLDPTIFILRWERGLLVQ